MAARSLELRLLDLLTGILVVRGLFGGCGGVMGWLSMLPRVLCRIESHVFVFNSKTGQNNFTKLFLVR